MTQPHRGPAAAPGKLPPHRGSGLEGGAGLRVGYAVTHVTARGSGHGAGDTPAGKPAVEETAVAQERKMGKQLQNRVNSITFAA